MPVSLRTVTRCDEGDEAPGHSGHRVRSEDAARSPTGMAAPRMPGRSASTTRARLCTWRVSVPVPQPISATRAGAGGGAPPGVGRARPLEPEGQPGRGRAHRRRRRPLDPRTPESLDQRRWVTISKSMPTRCFMRAGRRRFDAMSQVSMARHATLVLRDDRKGW